MISAVGSDENGDAIKVRMDQWGMNTSGIQTDHRHETGAVIVTTEDGEPSYEICEDRAWDHIQDEGHLATELIYHGSLALRNERSLSTLEAIVERSGAKRFFDINLRPPHYNTSVLKKWIQDADWVKLNIDELEQVLDTPSISFSDGAEYAEKVRSDFGVANVLLTAGSDGAMIVGDHGYAEIAPAPKPKSIVDTVGAGDAFTSVTIHGILNGHSSKMIVEKAGRFASKVCALRGATTEDENFYHLEHA
jgi:fructokinase